MGNCISKKSNIHHQQCRYSSTRPIPSSQRPIKQTLSLKLASPSSLNTSLEGHSIFRTHLSNLKETDIILNDNDEKDKKVIQYSSTSLLPTTTTTTSPPLSINEQLIFMHTPSILSPVQLSSECKKFKSSNTMIVFRENHIKQPFTLISNEQDTPMGHLFSNEKDINQENDNSDGGNEKMNIDIKVHITDNDQSKNHQYFTIINENKLSNRETMVNTREIVQGKLINNFNTSFLQAIYFVYMIISDSLDTCSPSPSSFDSSLSSLSSNTTPFSSQDRLILSSSSSSSSSSAVTSPLISTALIPLPPASSSPHTIKINSNNSRSLTYSEQIYLNNQSSYQYSSDDIFPAVLPISSSSSRYQNDFFINEFHQNILSHNCKTLRTVIDNVLQQQFIRIHQSSKVILIEHKQLECVHLK